MSNRSAILAHAGNGPSNGRYHAGRQRCESALSAPLPPIAIVHVPGRQPDVFPQQIGKIVTNARIIRQIAKSDQSVETGENDSHRSNATDWRRDFTVGDF